MNSTPEWLPDRVKLDGTWDEICTKLYQIFKANFILKRPKFQNIPVWHDRKKDSDGKYEEIFWHLIERKSNAEGERQFDIKRAEKLPWCAPTISNSNNPIISVWDYQEQKRNIRTYIWLEQFDYVVVLQKRRMRKGMIAWLITAYHVDGEKTRRNLRRKYARRIQ